MTGVRPARRRSRTVSAWATLGATLVAAAWLAGCASDSDSGSPNGATGGATGTGGKANATGGSSAGGAIGPGSGGNATGGSSATGGLPGAGGSSAGGAGGASAPCVVVIEAVAPYTLNDVVTGKGARLEVKARLTLGTSIGARWMWDVTRRPKGGSGVNVAVEPLTSDASTVAISTEVAGSYQIKATYPGVPLPCFAAVGFEAGAPKPQLMRWLVEPAIGANLPAKEIRMTLDDVRAGMPLDLGNTSVATIAPSTETLQIVPAYVRVTTSMMSGWSMEGSTASGPWNVPLLAGVTYDLLVIPSVKVGTPGAYAPVLVSGPPDRLGPPLPLSPGRALTVEARDEQGKPSPGVNAMFANAGLPSTLGTTGADGTVVVRTAAIAGTWTAKFSDSSTAGRYALRSDELDLTTATKLKVSWAPQDRTALSIAATDAGGTPLSNARVHLASQSPITGAGTLTVVHDDTSAATASAQGVFTADATTDARGMAGFPAVPTGSYTITLFPDNSAGLSPSAITAAPFAVSTSASSVTLRARSRVTFDGNVSTTKDCGASGANDRPCAGMKITALADTEEVTPTAVVGADGSFHLALDPLLTYELVARPGPQQFAPQTVLGTVSLSDTDAPPKTKFPLPDVTSTPVTVRAAGQVVAGAWVRVYCLPDAARCADPNLPLAEGRSDERGQLNLALPAGL